MSTAMAMAAVDVNKASEAELDSVKGIGPTTSKLITSERKKGDFKSWDDFITRVKGVGEKRAASLSDAGLTVAGQPYKHTTSKTADTRSDNKSADVKSEKKSAETKAEAKSTKAEADADKKAAKADAKAEKKEAKAEAKEAKAEAKADKAAASAKPSASAAKK
jgi:competence protein ComEA